MATLYEICTMVITDALGAVRKFRHGGASASDKVPMETTVSGHVYHSTGQIGTNASATIFDSSSDPSGWDRLCLKVNIDDVDAQFIATNGNFTIKMKKDTPLKLPTRSVYAVNNTTPITNAPTYENIASIVLNNDDTSNSCTWELFYVD